MTIISMQLLKKAEELENAFLVEIRKCCIELRVNSELLEKCLLEGHLPTHLTETSAIIEEMAECYLTLRDWRLAYETGKLDTL